MSCLLRIVFLTIVSMACSSLADRVLSCTAKSNLIELYVDGMHQSVPGDGQWTTADNITLSNDNRLIAVMAGDFTATCPGFLASVTNDFLVTTGAWKCTVTLYSNWNTLGFDDSGWNETYVIGPNGGVISPEECTVLTEIPSISSKAYWIWTNSLVIKPNYDATIYCRGYLPFCETASPCLNGGTCLTNNLNVCVCLPQYTGEYCETEIPATTTTQSVTTESTSHAENKTLTITAKSYLLELYVDGSRIRLLINEGRWLLTDDVDLSPDNRLISLAASDTSYSCAGILASVTDDFLVTDATWKCSTANTKGWHDLGFKDSDWSDAYLVGVNGNVTSPESCKFLTEIPSISSNAWWIWTDSIQNAPDYDMTVFCRGYLPTCERDSPCLNGGTCNRNDATLCTCKFGFIGKYCEAVLELYLNITSYDALSEVYIDGVPADLINQNDKTSIDSVFVPLDSRLVAVMAVSTVDNCSALIASVTGDYLVSNSSWKCSSFGANDWNRLEFDDSLWSPALVLGENGITPGCSNLGSVLGISLNAYWIWTEYSPPQEHQAPKAVFCRGYLPLCETDSPCQNGGTCLSKGETLCRCTPEWAGRHCEISYTPCVSEPCQNNGTCSVVGGRYVCTCSEEYAGVNCEKVLHKSLTITANTTLYKLYIDEIDMPLTNFDKWMIPDVIDLTAGNRLIATLAFDARSACGGVLASVTNEQLVTDSKWKCTGGNITSDWYRFAYDDSLWEDAHVIGLNGNVTSSASCTDFIEVPSISKNASWIWTSPVTSYESSVACRAYIPICELDNPCRNGATCRLKNTILCLCQSGFTGIYCESVINRMLTITAKSSLYELYIDGTNKSLPNGDDVTAPDKIQIWPMDRLVSLTAIDTSLTCPGVVASVTEDFLLSNNSWKCNKEGSPLWNTLGFNDDSWKQAFDIGINGGVTSPAACTSLPYIPSISPNAHWIWTDSVVAEPVYDQTLFCRAYIPLCEMDNPCWNAGTCYPNSATLCSCLPGFTGRYCDRVETKELKVTGEPQLYAVYIDGVQVSLRNGEFSNLLDSVVIGSITRLVALMATQLDDTCPGILAEIVDGSGNSILSGSQWKCSPSANVEWANLDFDDSSWMPAALVQQNINYSTSEAACPNLPHIPEISSSAYWIWTANSPPYDTTVFCRGLLPVCDSSPCQYGGTCNNIGVDLCTCQPGYFGEFCEQASLLNTAVLVGGQVTLSCKRPYQNVIWYYTTLGSSSPIMIARDCKVLQEYSEQYAMDTTDFSCHLLIANVQSTHAGTYSCMDGSSNAATTSSQLIVLHGIPYCSNSAGSILIGTYVTMTCQVSFSGNWPPTFSWKDSNGQSVTNATTQTSSNSVTSYIQIPGYFPSVPSFTNTLYFTDYSIPPITENDVPATNVPSYTYVTPTQTVNVVCPNGFVHLSSHNHCYQFIREGMKWDSADVRCRQSYPGAYLVVIADAAEQNDIANFLYGYDVSPCYGESNHNGVWTSGHVNGNGGSCYPYFVWQPFPGVQLPLTYTNWDPGEPNCSDDYEYCLEIFYQSGYTWNDNHCDHTFCPLCEYGLTVS